MIGCVSAHWDLGRPTQTQVQPPEGSVKWGPLFYFPGHKGVGGFFVCLFLFVFLSLRWSLYVAQAGPELVVHPSLVQLESQVCPPHPAP